MVRFNKLKYCLVPSLGFSAEHRQSSLLYRPQKNDVKNYEIDVASCKEKWLTGNCYTIITLTVGERTSLERHEDYTTNNSTLSQIEYTIEN